MTRGQQKERIIIVSQVETTDDEVSNTSRADGSRRKVAADVTTVNGQKAFQLGLDPMATNINVSTFAKVLPSDAIEWKGMMFRIGALNPVFARFGTYYELTCSTQDAI